MRREIFMHLKKRIRNIRDKAPRLRYSTRRDGICNCADTRAITRFHCNLDTRESIDAPSYVRTFVIDEGFGSSSFIIPFCPYHGGHELFKLRITTDIWAAGPKERKLEARKRMKKKKAPRVIARYLSRGWDISPRDQGMQ